MGRAKTDRLPEYLYAFLETQPGSSFSLDAMTKIAQHAMPSLNISDAEIATSLLLLSIEGEIDIFLATYMGNDSETWTTWYGTA